MRKCLDVYIQEGDEKALSRSSWAQWIDKNENVKNEEKLIGVYIQESDENRALLMLVILMKLLKQTKSGRKYENKKKIIVYLTIEGTPTKLMNQTKKYLK